MDGETEILDAKEQQRRLVQDMRDRDWQEEIDKRAEALALTYQLKCDGSSGDYKTEQRMVHLMVELFERWKNKHKIYGRDNISRFGEKGILVRVNDKLQYLTRLVWPGPPSCLYDEETIDDSWRDLVIYGLIAILVRRKAWPTNDNDE